jgi:hypothetical protein
VGSERAGQPLAASWREQNWTYVKSRTAQYYAAFHLAKEDLHFIEVGAHEW